jgi:hypothetical protein
MLSGHTHGGQICLPCSIPIKLEAVLPRRMGAGAWRYRNMTGYTSVGAGSSVLPRPKLLCIAFGAHDREAHRCPPVANTVKNESRRQTSRFVTIFLCADCVAAALRRKSAQAISSTISGRPLASPDPCAVASVERLSCHRKCRRVPRNGIAFFDADI